MRDETSSPVCKASANRVLMVSNFLSPGGTSRGACEELAERLSGAGLKVITTSQQTGRLARLADMVSTVWRCRKQYDVAQVDVYSGQAFVWAEAACAALRALRKPYVLTLHGGGLPDFASKWTRRVRYLLGSAFAVTTPSEYLRNAMLPYRSTLQLIPNSIDIARYEYRQRTNPQPTLVWLRSLHECYNPVLAVQVLANISRDYPEARLIMVGPDKGDGSREQVESEADQLGVRDRLTLTGVVPKIDIPKELARGDIFLNTADIDNAPVSVIEAMACGLCVVSTNVGGIPFLCEHENDSLLVPARDAEAMSGAVRQIMTDSALAGSLSENARRKTEQFDWSMTLPAWQDLLSNASGRNPSYQ